MNKTTAVVGLICLAVGAVLGAGIVLKSCGPDPAYWVSRGEYNQQVADMEARLQESLLILAERDKVIAQQDEIITLGQKKIIELEKDNATLRRTEADQTAEIQELKTAEVIELLERYPALRIYDLAKDRLLETKDKVILNLTLQGQEKDKIIEAQGIEIVALKYQRDIWKKTWEDERALRLTGDSLCLSLEKRLYGGKLWKYVALVESALFGAIIIFTK